MCIMYIYRYIAINHFGKCNYLNKIQNFMIYIYVYIMQYFLCASCI